MPRRVSGTGSATVAADGSATVFVAGPFRNLTSWLISTVVCESVPSGSGSFPECDVYRGTVSPSSLLGHSRSADNVTFEGDSADRLLQGDQLIVVFVGCSPGSSARVNLFADEVGP